RRVSGGRRPGGAARSSALLRERVGTRKGRRDSLGAGSAGPARGTEGELAVGVALRGADGLAARRRPARRGATGGGPGRGGDAGPGSVSAPARVPDLRRAGSGGGGM